MPSAAPPPERFRCYTAREVPRTRKTAKKAHPKGRRSTTARPPRPRASDLSQSLDRQAEAGDVEKPQAGPETEAAAVPSARSDAARIRAIRDPKQRAVARQIGAICDLFSAEFAALPPAERLAGRTRSTGPADRLRVATRVFAIGAVISLGKELGLPAAALHGKADGRTEIIELRGLYHNTCIHAGASFEALLRDGGAIGSTIAERYAQILRDARREVEATTEADRPAG